MLRGLRSAIGGTRNAKDTGPEQRTLKSSSRLPPCVEPCGPRPLSRLGLFFVLARPMYHPLQHSERHPSSRRKPSVGTASKESAAPWADGGTSAATETRAASWLCNFSCGGSTSREPDIFGRPFRVPFSDGKKRHVWQRSETASNPTGSQWALPFGATGLSTNRVPMKVSLGFTALGRTRRDNANDGKRRPRAGSRSCYAGHVRLQSGTDCSSISIMSLVSGLPTKALCVVHKSCSNQSSSIFSLSFS